MAFRYRVVVLIYVFALLPAGLMLDCGSPPRAPKCDWHAFGLFELLVPTIIAALFLVIAWVLTPQHRRQI